MPGRRPQDQTDDEPAIGIDSAGVYEGLSAEDLGYGELPRVADEEAAAPED